jgi:hypothetical protein
MMVAREPIGEIENETREEPGLGDAEQKTNDAKAGGPGDRSGDHGQDAPRDHDAGDPQACTDLFHDQIARQLEDRVAPIKGAEGKPEGGGRHGQIVAHRQSGEADVDPVDIGKQIAHHGKGQKPPIDLAHRRCLDGVFHALDLLRSPVARHGEP